MIELFLSYMHQHRMLEKDDTVLLAVSGGVDSMVMADLFKQAQLPIAVAHVNFGLRGLESDQDEVFVKKWCENREIDCYSKHASADLYQGDESVQMVARAFRYKFFRDLMKQHKLQKVATAHHLDDSIETVIYNLSKGTGLRGLTGINPINEDIIRPLLFATKDEILDYAKSKGISWREDISNQGITYQRNKIRNQVMPVLKAINPGLHGTFSNTSQRLSDARNLISEVVHNIASQYVQSINGGVTIDLGWISNYQHTRTILYELLRRFGYSYAQVVQIEASVEAGEIGKIYYSHDWVLNLDREQLLIKKNSNLEWDDVTLKIGGETVINNCVITATMVQGNEWKDHHDPDIAYVDFDLVKDPVIGKWQHGEHFYPLGMKGKKKISDFMIDSKIPLTLKRDVLLIRSEGEVVWIAGYRVDDRYKVTPGTKKMLRLQLNSNV